MNTNTKMKKLVLSKETLRDLSNAELQKIAGGRPPANGETAVSDCYTGGGACRTGEYYGCCR